MGGGLGSGGIAPNIPPFRGSHRWPPLCTSQTVTSLIAHLRSDTVGRLVVFRKGPPMIQQTTPTEQASAERLSPQEALVSLLIASARADGSVSAQEANSIEHVVAGMKLFRG